MPGIEVQAVAEALEIHPFMLSRWRKEARDAHVAAAHTRQYRDELQPLTGSPLDERVYTFIQ